MTSLCCAQVPVGRETLGRIMNVIGEPVDECGPISERFLAWIQLRIDVMHCLICAVPRPLALHMTHEHINSPRVCRLRRCQAPLGYPQRGSSFRGAVN